MTVPDVSRAVGDGIEFQFEVGILVTGMAVETKVKTSRMT